jgi:hypothetical protein
VSTDQRSDHAARAIAMTIILAICAIVVYAAWLAHRHV